MLFKPEHVDMILAGKKTQTRRAWKRPMAKIGGVYRVKTKMLSKEYHCLIEVVAIRKEKLKLITEADAKLEGYGTVWQYITVWELINGSWDGNQEVYVIDFRVNGGGGR